MTSSDLFACVRIILNRQGFNVCFKDKHKFYILISCNFQILTLHKL